MRDTDQITNRHAARLLGKLERDGSALTERAKSDIKRQFHWLVEDVAGALTVKHGKGRGDGNHRH